MCVALAGGQVGHKGLLNETLTPDRPCRDTQDCSGRTEQNALEAQDLPCCTYLAHHELESSITITTVIIVVGTIVNIIDIDQQEQTNEHKRKNEGMAMNEGTQ